MAATRRGDYDSRRNAAKLTNHMPQRAALAI
jgi:hypothetical protein